ncbi:hypothetical protein Drorol1_Dr00001969 [Drosera rotundifolia]
MKEIDVKQRLVEKCYELMREKEMALGEKLDQLRLKEEQRGETKAMATWMWKTSEILGMFAEELEEFEVKDKSKEKELGEKMKDIELNKQQLKGKSFTKDNGMPLHLLESMEAKGEVAVDAVHPPQQSDLIVFTIEEKIDVALSSLGKIYYFDVVDRLSAQILEKKDADIQVQVELGGNHDIMFKTHPKIDEALYMKLHQCLNCKMLLVWCRFQNFRSYPT